MSYIFSSLGRKLTIGIKGSIGREFAFGKDIEDELKSNERISELVVVMRHVEHIEPEGLNNMMKQLNKYAERGLELTFLELPKQFFEIFMEQTRELRAKQVRSFYLPFYCDSCNEEYPQLINTSSMLLSFQSYTKPRCPVCGKQLSIDITEDEIQRIVSLLPVDNSYKDKRRYPRFDVSAYNIKATVEYNGVTKEFELVNFSEEGVCIIGDTFIAGGDNVKIKVKYKNKEAVSTGSAVWHSAQGATLFYTGLFLNDNNIYKLLYKL